MIYTRSKSFKYLKIGRFVLVALSAFQFHSEARGPSFLRKHPFAHPKRRIVPHMLGVAAIEQGPPVRLVVELKIDYVLLHGFAI